MMNPAAATSRSDSKRLESVSIFPWPKGSEMPFPWKTVGGAYNLKAKTSSLYAGHYFQLSVGYDETRRRYLSVNQYDRSGRLFASGRGYPERNPRFINADMVTHITNRAYESLIRAYEGEVIGNDKPKYPVLAVSFCPMRGKNCIGTYASYVLEKVE